MQMIQTTFQSYRVCASRFEPISSRHLPSDYPKLIHSIFVKAFSDTSLWRVSAATKGLNKSMETKSGE